MATVLYRVSSGEVIRVSTSNEPFNSVDLGYFGVLSDPNFPDGMALQETLANGTKGPFRQLGFAKIADAALGQVRNATQAEIDLFQVERLLDDEELREETAVDFILSHPVMKRVFELVLEEVDAPGRSSTAGAAGRARGRRNPLPPGAPPRSERRGRNVNQ
jgi:hypothetical protein